MERVLPGNEGGGTDYLFLLGQPAGLTRIGDGTRRKWLTSSGRLEPEGAEPAYASICQRAFAWMTDGRNVRFLANQSSLSSALMSRSWGRIATHSGRRRWSR